MNRSRPLAQARATARDRPPSREYGAFTALGLVGLNLLVNIGATTAFAVSGRSETFRNFLTWQLVGSAFGLGTQLTFAGLVRVSSVQIAGAIGIGLAFVSAEVVTAHRLFH